MFAWTVVPLSSCLTRKEYTIAVKLWCELDENSRCSHRANIRRENRFTREQRCELWILVRIVHHRFLEFRCSARDDTTDERMDVFLLCLEDTRTSWLRDFECNPAESNRINVSDNLTIVLNRQALVTKVTVDFDFHTSGNCLRAFHKKIIPQRIKLWWDIYERDCICASGNSLHALSSFFNQGRKSLYVPQPFLLS